MNKENIHMKRKLLLGTLSLSLFAGTFPGCANGKASDFDYDTKLTGVLLSFVSGAGSASTCETNVPFSAVVSATSPSCGGCHSSGNPQGGVDLSSYNSTLAKVVAGSPETSALYTSIKSGTMASYSDATIENAVYCWILAGATEN